jgi:nitrite reductase/ring-hydroxylating ferredoxin subunit/uncharacterized membrane protein
MDRVSSEKILEKVPNFKDTAFTVSREIHNEVLENGSPLRRLFDLLHGTWLGHPLHSVLTDFVIGAWVMGGVVDLLAAQNRSRQMEKTADTLIALGAASALPTALAGVADYSTIPRRAVATGAVHALLNTAGLLLNLVSLAQRRAGQRTGGVFSSAAALGLMTVSAWLGGELSYRYQVGVNKSPPTSGPEEWTPVLNDADLPEREPYRVEVGGQPVLLYRFNGAVYAMGAVCGHDGAPLEQGKFDGLCVECPWHQSVYDLRDGSVVHGPTTYAEPVYLTRIQNGQIELRLRV